MPDCRPERRGWARVTADALVELADLVELTRRCGSEPAVQACSHEVGVVSDLGTGQGARGDVDGARAGDLGEGPGVVIGDLGHQLDRSAEGGARPAEGRVRLMRPSWTRQRRHGGQEARECGQVGADDVVVRCWADQRGELAAQGLPAPTACDERAGWAGGAGVERGGVGVHGDADGCEVAQGGH